MDHKLIGGGLGICGLGQKVARPGLNNSAA